MYRCIMHTMKQPKSNPVIWVYPHTGKKRNMFAAQAEETMQDTGERLAQAELERLQKGGKDASHEENQAHCD